MTSTKDILAQDIINGLRNRIAELESRYKAACGLALTWGNYFNRAILEQAIDQIVQEKDDE